jgi:hypothetical protein
MLADLEAYRRAHPNHEPILVDRLVEMLEALKASDVPIH